MENEKLLTAEDLAEVLGVSVSSVYRRRSLGLPFPRAVKFGRNLRWRKQDVDAFLEDHLERPNAQTDQRRIPC